MSAVQKKKPTLEQQVNEEGIRFLGKHVSREKAAALFAATLLACAMPMILGVRDWARIPQMVTTGLVGINGEDDSLPRVHAGVGKHQCRVILDDHRGRGYNLVTLACHKI